MEEVRKPIKGYENLYEITSSGKVFSLKRKRTLARCGDEYGFQNVKLLKDGKATYHNVFELWKQSFSDLSESVFRGVKFDSLKHRKPVYFSKYIDVEHIHTEPNTIDASDLYRYSISMPFKERHQSKKAIVIMKNPSKAGKFDMKFQRKLSDETIYRVTDYLYKHEQNFSNVIILNLFAIYSSIFDKNVKEDLLYGNNNMEINNRVIISTLKEMQEDDIVIAAWGGYPNRAGFRDNYRERVKEVMTLLDGITLWSVGELVKTDSRYFPQHGLNWYDYEEFKELKR
ncbi:DUF1643 domain-containing protein [Niallia taxi]|uniref:DUF1643 domain-containing protein n=1 Tax=Niallia taxi TaxID=2499688 RepID=UPI002E241D02|nr:DUF1643 domain-containing protein [Niallia taxi]